ncbi:MAG: hypothetical protein LKJ13_00605 [Clostridia bacterium]|jgi:uncharacterized membrane protein YkvI|nr:hypothetical protein [Clostridia bacterium]MCI1999326.1 hypothetical protein [Clostridia bacterium]MCI2015172.1 hypothetical protein [Clostridia bacterium]
MSKDDFPKLGFMATFSVASVWFASHAGGGFATGNQATQYYVQYGWFAPIMAVITMAILALELRELMVLYNTHGCKNYKDLFYALYHPYDKLEILFEIYFYIIVICAVSAAIAGAATLFTKVGLSYGLGVIVVGILLIIFTIFGAQLVAKASTVMSIIILICSFTIFISGIKYGWSGIKEVFSTHWATTGIGLPIWKVFTYAGFQSVVVPAMVACGASLKTKRNVSLACLWGFIINAAALAVSCLMLLGWYSQYMAAGKTAIALPCIYICEQINPALTYVYSISLFLCFVSTGVTSIYGLVTRFETNPGLEKLFKNTTARRAFLSFIGIIISMAFSLFGLTNIIKYGYGYCGYFGIFVIVLPAIFIGHVKNKKFLAEHPEWIGK